jgi:hypothetical protein
VLRTKALIGGQRIIKSPFHHFYWSSSSVTDQYQIAHINKLPTIRQRQMSSILEIRFMRIIGTKHHLA